MSTLLPVSSELHGLPLRAIVAYAYRTACRVMVRSELQQLGALRHQLACLEEFARSPTISEDIAARVAMATAELIGSRRWLPESADVLLAFARAADCCVAAAMALSGEHTKEQQRSADAARKATEAAERLSAADARRSISDYEVLLRLFGPYESGMLGEAFDPTESGPLGPL